MPRPKTSPEDVAERERRAKEMKSFLKDNLITEARMADIVGIARRTVQMIKSGLVSPHKDTQEKIDKLMNKHRENGWHSSEK